ncbi:hypothetical protein CK203_051361 [Vitis vinifera]|uniref:Uncharacterized protein n=1 Tax=Vitis vinifera TaxID=29760 RepID=A0A438FLW8_VITVI|nr:hypothetical protein CK203_051361 [Vitis vinifera]
MLNVEFLHGKLFLAAIRSHMLSMAFLQQAELCRNEGCGTQWQNASITDAIEEEDEPSRPSQRQPPPPAAATRKRLRSCKTEDGENGGPSSSQTSVPVSTDFRRITRNSARLGDDTFICTPIFHPNIPDNIRNMVWAAVQDALSMQPRPMSPSLIGLMSSSGLGLGLGRTTRMLGC